MVQAKVPMARPGFFLSAVLAAMALVAFSPRWAVAQADDPSPPSAPVKLIFIHHSCGENWLADDQGALGLALAASNYFVSDTNYGWGPDSIGDRTDITDWPEWFTGPNSDRYLAALYAESEQNSWFTRTLPDPGGENQIVLFKSCFPNSDLEGHPDDPPSRGGGLTVGNAKAVYIGLLERFALRPDKLFVAITAPPLLDSTNADNARAFNTWLVEDWLAGYGGSNVAVWDYFNVLTGPDNHHHFANGAVKHVTGAGLGTLHYPTDGDEHPSPTGNRKATEEFVPVLNVFYNRWQPGPPAAPAPTPEKPVEGVSEPAAPADPTPALAGGIVEGFEAESYEWQMFTDGHSGTALTCQRAEGESHSGAWALHIDYKVTGEGWAGCSLVYPAPVDWQQGRGLSFYLRAGEAGAPVVIVIYGGASADELFHFEHRAETSREAVDGWQRVEIAWDDFRLVEWQGDPATPFDTRQAMGLAFNFDPETSGWLKVDDVGLLEVVAAAPGSEETTTAPPVAAAATGTPSPEAASERSPAEDEVEGAAASGSDEQHEEEPQAEQPAATAQQGEERGGMCPGSAALGMIGLVGAFWTQRRRIHR